MKRAFLFAVCMLASFFIGFFYKNQIKEEVVPTYSEVTVKEENSLKSSIDKVYNSVVVIETYDSVEDHKKSNGITNLNDLIENND